MDMVWEQLTARNIPFPMFRLDKGGVSAIERFKASGNGVLFASGALWEGIDIPGDALSLLIIVRLPFAVPDPISDYERTLHADMDAYKTKVVVPDMLLKLKQGFGRLIRMEADTGVCAILDIRARTGGSYREYTLRALPACAVTSSIADIEAFMRRKKTPEYFTGKRYSHNGNRLEG
jgi:ATP-dependent DNA helicase DinG